MCGYYATPREEATPEGYTHDWTAFVKGDHERDVEEDGSDLKHVVRKVVFQLHEDFKPNATRGIMINIAIIKSNSSYINWLAWQLYS